MDITTAQSIAESKGYDVYINLGGHGSKQIEVKDVNGLVFRYWDFEPDFESKLERCVNRLRNKQLTR
mgnify:CR=1 FL=1